jgi:heme-degrading monooxygenase HmoA
MSAPFTAGIWTVKPGHADEFIAAWSGLADWTKANVQGAGWAKLLRDLDDPNRFVSVGVWESLEAIEAWRANDGWSSRVGPIKELLVGFEAITLDAAVEVD